MMGQYFFPDYYSAYDEAPVGTLIEQAKTEGKCPVLRLPPAIQSVDETRTKASEMFPKLRELISAKAFMIWLSKGRPEGTDRENWLEAERQVLGF